MSFFPRAVVVVSPLTLVAGLLAGCSFEVEPRIDAGLDACNACGMVIDQPRQAGAGADHSYGREISLFAHRRQPADASGSNPDG